MSKAIGIGGSNMDTWYFIRMRSKGPGIVLGERCIPG